MRYEQHPGASWQSRCPSPAPSLGNPPYTNPWGGGAWLPSPLCFLTSARREPCGPKPPSPACRGDSRPSVPGNGQRLPRSSAPFPPAPLGSLGDARISLDTSCFGCSSFTCRSLLILAISWCCDATFGQALPLPNPSKTPSGACSCPAVAASWLRTVPPRRSPAPQGRRPWL